MTALIIGVAALSLGAGAVIGITVGDDYEQAVGYSSLALIAVGLFAFGFGLARVLA